MNDDFEPGFFEQLANSFNEGGVIMYPLAALGCLLPLLAIGFLIAGTISTRNRALPLAVALLLLAVLPPALGTFAARSSRVQVEEALRNVSPADRETIRAAAESELQARRSRRNQRPSKQGRAHLSGEQQRGLRSPRSRPGRSRVHRSQVLPSCSRPCRHKH